MKTWTAALAATLGGFELVSAVGRGVWQRVQTALLTGFNRVHRGQEYCSGDYKHTRVGDAERING